MHKKDLKLASNFYKDYQCPLCHTLYQVTLLYDVLNHKRIHEREDIASAGVYLFNYSQVAKLYGVSRVTIDGYVKRDLITATNIGDEKAPACRITESEVVRFYYAYIKEYKRKKEALKRKRQS